MSLSLRGFFTIFLLSIFLGFFGCGLKGSAEDTLFVKGS